MRQRYIIKRKDIIIGKKEINVFFSKDVIILKIYEQFGQNNLFKEIKADSTNYSLLKFTYEDKHMTENKITINKFNNYYIDNMKNKLFCGNVLYDYDTMLFFLPYICQSEHSSYYCINDISKILLCTIKKESATSYIQIHPNYVFMKYNDLVLNRIFNNVTKEELILM